MFLMFNDNDCYPALYYIFNLILSNKKDWPSKLLGKIIKISYNLKSKKRLSCFLAV